MNELRTKQIFTQNIVTGQCLQQFEDLFVWPRANSDQNKNAKLPCAVFINVVSAITRHWITVMTIKVPASLCFIIVFKIRMSVLNTIIQNCNYHTTSCDIFSPHWHDIDVKSPRSYSLSCRILIRK